MTCEPSVPSLFPADFDSRQFLGRYWQQQPLLIRGGDPELADPIDPDELAGLACQADVESRLVRHQPEQDRWQLEHGPFSEARLRALPTSHCNLLVQAVDQWHQPARRLLQAFRFIPAWRIDDVMISYANDGGSVGPHFDYYDVFLIQGRGRKRWRLGPVCDRNMPLRDDCELSLLPEFETQAEYTTATGDILYLPPGVAHHGVSLGESMTVSVGFRAPSLAEITAELGTVLAQQLGDDQRYRDPSAEAPAQPGLIPDEVGNQLQQILRRQLDQPALMRRWFGEYMTLPRYPEQAMAPSANAPASIEALDARLRAGAVAVCNPASRFAFSRENGNLQLFADGEPLDCPRELQWLAEALSEPGHDALPVAGGLDRTALALVLQLMQQGSVLLDQTSANTEGVGCS